MTFKKTLAVATCVAAIAAVASSAMAQTPPAAPRPAAAAPAAGAAPAPVRHGPVIPGVCVYSGAAAVENSEVGKYVGTRMKQLVTEANAELNNERTAVQNEAKTLDASRATIGQDAYEQRGAALQVRANALQRKEALRQREIEVTERKAVLRVLQELNPIVTNLYQQRNCSILLGEGVLAANEQMDLTSAAVAALNQKLKTFPFNRERLDAPQTAPAVAAPATPPKK